MRAIRDFFIVTLLLCALPMTAHAQWATHRVEHDWRIRMGDNSLGITQEFVSTYSYTLGNRTTYVYLGPLTFKTSVPAVWIATFAVVPFAMMGFFLITSPRKRTELEAVRSDCAAS